MGDQREQAAAKYYSLTKAGQKVLDRETAQWERLSAAISLVVRAV
jgi:hypothetical protein